MILVCLMAMAVSVNAQNWSLQAKQNAVKIIKSKLKSPSSFMLTDAYGNRIPLSKIRATYIHESIEYDSMVYYKDEFAIDSIIYICDKITNIIVDSLVYESYRNLMIDSVVYLKRVYPACYKCSFYYEAQNSYGGMVQDFATVYVEKNGCVSRNYETYRYRTYKIGKKNVFKQLPNPPIKIKKVGLERLSKINAMTTYHKILDKWIDALLNSRYEEADVLHGLMLRIEKAKEARKAKWQEQIESLLGE